MHAIVQLGGKQYMVKEQDVLRVEKLEPTKENTYNTKDVLLVSDGKGAKIGTPFISGASVDFKVIKSGKSDKVRVFKMKAKKRYKKLRGHRQEFTEIEVVKIKA